MTTLELITWHPVNDRMPDTDTTVECLLDGDSEPSWPGWWDGTTWCSATTGGQFASPVIAWAERPSGTPSEATRIAMEWLDFDQMAVGWDLRRLVADLVGRRTKPDQQAPHPVPELCNYPNCRCPFDAPADPDWCARGLPHAPRNTELSGHQRPARKDEK